MYLSQNLFGDIQRLQQVILGDYILSIAIHNALRQTWIAQELQNAECKLYSDRVVIYNTNNKWAEDDFCAL